MHLHKPLILASRSPRRISLLEQIGISPEVLPCDVPEEFDPKVGPAENAVALALRKAREAARGVADGIVAGADTIVAIDGMMLGKPTDRADAIRMLEILSGRTHTVYTAFALVDCPSGRELAEFEATKVTFRVLPRAEIEEYVDRGSPMDKAGAYGIQDDYGAVFVTRVEGCFYNVMGLPLSRFFTALHEFQSHV